MKHIACPVLFIHGERDNLIPSQHSQTLYNSFKSTGNKELVLLPDDDHNSISDPILNINLKPFIDKYFESTTEPMPEVQIDPALRQSLTINPNSGSTPWWLSALSSVTNASRSALSSTVNVSKSAWHSTTNASGSPPSTAASELTPLDAAINASGSPPSNTVNASSAAFSHTQKASM